MRRFLLALVMLTAGLAVACAGDGRPRSAASTASRNTDNRSVPDTAGARIRGITLDARHPPDEATLERLHTLGVTHLTLVSFGFQPAHDEPQIRMHTESGWFSESDAGIRALARQAGELGMRVILKPHIWVGDYSEDGQARHKIAFDTDADWQQWEQQYRRFLMHYARLAQEIEAAVLVVGTELAHAARTRPAFWRQLISEIRTVYDGKLTYAANWYEEFEHIPFWDALDYIGVQAYFPLSEANDPSPRALRQGWEPHCEALARLHQETGQPILFTEIGYRSVPYAAARPWQWPSREERHAVEPDRALQARLYRAFFEVVWDAPWLAGALLWKWQPAARGRRPLGFAFRDKPAEEVIERAFQAQP